MGQRNTDTALLIFSLSARREADRKGLFGIGKKRSVNELFDILIGRTREMAAASGVDAFIIDEGKQHGRTFGERYANAFQQIFDQGYTKVISIGNDAPDLTAETLRTAIDQIQQNDLVVGPSTDGGVYLLGLSRSLFDTDEFLNLPWLQDSLYDTLSQGAYWQQGGSFSLHWLSDIDDTASLLRFVQNTSDNFLRGFILIHLYRSKTSYGHRAATLFFDVHTSSQTLRGPPFTHTYSKSVQKAA
ncbi:DUF2064 domain-containing protein [Pricia sp.]|uniref:TIGR04282 family arsenosugar biosynthesis glycosyltransferase n=1 Tax=Pricia sp. TaxID=2268138 RepID=UPI003594223D